MTHDNPAYVNLLIDPSRPPTLEEQMIQQLRLRDLCDAELTTPEIRAMKRLRKKGLVFRSLEKDWEFGWSWRLNAR